LSKNIYISEQQKKYMTGRIGTLSQKYAENVKHYEAQVAKGVDVTGTVLDPVTGNDKLEPTDKPRKLKMRDIPQFFHNDMVFKKEFYKGPKFWAEEKRLEALRDKPLPISYVQVPFFTTSTAALLSLVCRGKPIGLFLQLKMRMRCLMSQRSRSPPPNKRRSVLPVTYIVAFLNK
jgi:hypothetical protein